MTPESLPLVYFGKLPARGDFVRARTHIPESNAIDEWVSKALVSSETLFSDRLVDRTTTNKTAFLNFSHVNTTSNEIITGVLIPSHDSSYRNYPIIGFGVQYVDKPKSWMNYLPIKSAAIWEDTHEILSIAKSKTDNAELMDYLNH
ncbi:MAG: type VI secretion system-associated protein TagF, partial [Psychrobacter sp.]